MITLSKVARLRTATPKAQFEEIRLLRRRSGQSLADTLAAGAVTFAVALAVEQMVPEPVQELLTACSLIGALAFVLIVRTVQREPTVAVEWLAAFADAVPSKHPPRFGNRYAGLRNLRGRPRGMFRR